MMQEASPSVSVIVLTFNSSAYIARCLNSLLAQTRDDFEAVVVDAGSTDDTVAIVRRYDRRFRLLELPGSDMGAARNYGAQVSRGQYLCFLDSDDLYLPRKLEFQVAALEAAPAVDVHFCRAYHFRTGSPERVGVTPARGERMPVHWFLSGGNENLNTMCLRRRLWDRGHHFGEGNRGRYGEEWRHQLAMALAGVTMHHDNAPLVVVELRPDSHTVWERQWVMKQQAIAEIQEVAARLSAEQRRGLQVDTVIDSFRIKLVFAQMLAGRMWDARVAAAAIGRKNRARMLLAMVAIVGLLPQPIVGPLIKRLWLWRQNRLFNWIPSPVEVKNALAATACLRDDIDSATVRKSKPAS